MSATPARYRIFHLWHRGHSYRQLRTTCDTLRWAKERAVDLTQREAVPYVVVDDTGLVLATGGNRVPGQTLTTRVSDVIGTRPYPEYVYGFVGRKQTLRWRKAIAKVGLNWRERQQLWARYIRTDRISADFDRLSEWQQLVVDAYNTLTRAAGLDPEDNVIE